jgi:RimJ/RimL family protein N-acetyltransferase
MAINIWEGQRIRLRAVEPTDAEAHWLWNQDSQTSRRVDHVYFPQSREAARRWAERASVPERVGDDFHFEIETGAGELVGSLGTHMCDARNGTFALGVAVREEHRRRGYASEAIRLVLRYYFEELRYQKVTVQIYSFNEASILLFEHLGFQHEGRLRRMIFTQGRFFDMLALGMTAEEFAARPP